MTNIATFYTHFGALTFQREQKRQGLNAQMMPVPRALSASCGVCVRFAQEEEPQVEGATDLEGLYQEENGGYRCVFQAE